MMCYEIGQLRVLLTVNLRTPAINSSLEITISRVRLSKYLVDKNGDLDAALSLYERNMRLAEAFYTPLQCLEICLRNKVHERRSNVYGEDWFDNGNAPLNNDAKRMIADAYAQLSNMAGPITPDAVVAEVRFSFWVGLLGHAYDNTLWRNALYKAFQRGSGRKRSVVHSRFNAIRRFRNRIAHHEPIFHRDVAGMHSEILDAIGWMCGDTCSWASHHSRVVAVINSN